MDGAVAAAVGGVAAVVDEVQVVGAEDVPLALVELVIVEKVQESWDS